MKTYNQFLKRSVRYKIPNYSTLGVKEYSEILRQSEDMYKRPSFYKEVPKEIKEAILKFAKNKSSWFTAIRGVKQEKLQPGMKVRSADVAMTMTQLDKAKAIRKQKQTQVDPIDRPIILRHGNFNYIISKTPRFTVVDFGSEAFIIEV